MPKDLIVTYELIEDTPLGKELLTKISNPVEARSFAVLVFIMSERKRDPEDSEFAPLFDLMPKSLDEFPLFFDEKELSYLDGSTMKELIKEE